MKGSIIIIVINIKAAVLLAEVLLHMVKEVRIDDFFSICQ